MRGITVLIIGCILGLMSCSEEQKASDVKPYFDIKSFFHSQAGRLQQSNPRVVKTVMQDNEREQKEVKIGNWNNELDLFIASDINKPSWKRSYRVQKENGKTRYTALEEGLKTREIIIERSTKGLVHHISIRNRVNNALYQSEELLDYYPDSLYSIKKSQNVRVLGAKRFQVVGKFEKAN